jgi:hypothetical protein
VNVWQGQGAFEGPPDSEYRARFLEIGAAKLKLFGHEIGKKFRDISRT